MKSKDQFGVKRRKLWATGLIKSEYIYSIHMQTHHLGDEIYLQSESFFPTIPPLSKGGGGIH